MEPFQGDARMIGVQAPTVERFVGDHVSFHAVLTEIPVASRGNGDVGKGIEASQRLKYGLEGETPLLEEFDVRFAVLSQVLLEVVDDVGHTLSSMPRLKVPSRRYRHDVWHKVGSVRNASDVGLRADRAKDRNQARQSLLEQQQHEHEVAREQAAKHCKLNESGQQVSKIDFAASSGEEILESESMTSEIPDFQVQEPPEKEATTQTEGPEQNEASSQSEEFDYLFRPAGYLAPDQ